MKKVIIMCFLLLSMSVSTYAEAKDVFLDLHQKGNNQRDHGVHRSPMHLSFEVFYDSETHIVEVCGDEATEAEVFLYNASGDLVNYSSSLNTELTIPTSGIYTIQIESEGWYALGVIEAQKEQN